MTARGNQQTRDVSLSVAGPHPLQANGGQVFPKIQIDMFPRLERFDVDLDLPEAFLPEFPPAIFLNESPGTRRCLARRGRLDQQLLPIVQRHTDAGAAGWPAYLLTTVSTGGIQSHR